LVKSPLITTNARFFFLSLVFDGNKPFGSSKKMQRWTWLSKQQEARRACGDQVWHLKKVEGDTLSHSWCMDGARKYGNNMF
jgi:hypothetical protein